MEDFCLRELEQYVSAEEQLRAKRFRFPVHRARFVAGRGILRSILARYLDCSPGALGFSYSRFGKPYVGDEKTPPIHFNVAHSANRFILAVAGRPVGVDLERIESHSKNLSELDSLANHVFSNAELSQWGRIPDSHRTEAFLSLWTRKEALLKGIGLGIAHHVKDVSVFFHTDDDVIVPLELSPKNWKVQSFVEKDVVWSVATPFEGAKIAKSCGGGL